MTKTLQQAFEHLSIELSSEEQNQFAQLVLSDFDQIRNLILIAEDEQKWNQSFAASQDGLSKMADEALAEHAAGLTIPMKNCHRLN